MEVVRRSFRPEFLNRLDEILLFHRLTREQMDGVVDIQLGRLRKLLDERKITLELDAAAMRWLAEAGYDPIYGARPLKRVIQRSLQNPLATLLLEGKLTDGQTVKVTVENNGLVVNGSHASSLGLLVILSCATVRARPARAKNHSHQPRENTEKPAGGGNGGPAPLPNAGLLAGLQ